MHNQARNLKEEANVLINMAARLKAMAIRIENIIIVLEQISHEKTNFARELNAKARVENLKIYEVRVKRPSGKRKTKVYSYWYASWRMNSKIRNTCLGSTGVMTYEEALEKAQKLKAESLGINF